MRARDARSGRLHEGLRPPPGRNPAGRWRWSRRLGRWTLTLVIAFAAMFLGLLLTPDVSVSTFGQTIQVGAVRPPDALHLRGPGQADLFGEGTVATVESFTSFVRPLIVWRTFHQAVAASQFIQAFGPGGTLGATLDQAGRALASGWERYLLQLGAAAALLGLVVHLVLIGAGAVARRSPARHPARRLVATALVSLLVTAAFSGLTVATADRQLRGVRSLADLVGTRQLAAAPVPRAPVRTGAHAVVIGDSTAAGDGNAPLADPTVQDTACSRSRDSYAAKLQAVTGSTVLNLACSSATIAHGLLGPQFIRGRTVPSQVGVLESMTSETAVIVSVGANDVGWKDFLAYCAVATQCDDRATEQLFQSRLDTFRIHYAQLLQQLADLPGHPTVIVNLYYQPFGSSVACLGSGAAGGRPSGAGTGTASATGSSPSSRTSSSPPSDSRLRSSETTLRAELDALNAVLAKGARAFHDQVAQQDFSGHELCTAQPWVQGRGAAAPFHPNAAGELAIAAADLPHLLKAADAGGGG